MVALGTRQDLRDAAWLFLLQVEHAGRPLIAVCSKAHSVAETNPAPPRRVPDIVASTHVQ